MICRLILILIALSFVSGFSNRLSADEPPRYNIVLVMADDLACRLGCYGDEQARTPQIDRFARRGVLFTRAYCNYPVCNASRASMLSGLRPTTTRVLDNQTPPRTRLPNQLMLPECFRGNGYRTVKIGKIFHTGDEFEDPRSWDVDERESAEAKTPPKDQIIGRQGDGIILGVEDAETWDGHVARRAVGLLEDAAGGNRPFFLAVGFRRPHRPYIAPRRYFDLYPVNTISLPNEAAAHLRGIPPIALTYRPGDPRPSGEELRMLTAAYYASLSFMDAQVGVILDALDRLNLWDRTIVVFVSDHGYHLGEHGGLLHKMSLFEESARVPLIVAAPHRATGRKAKGLIELIDLYPTLTDLCGLPCPISLEGASFDALLSDPEQPGKPAAYTVVNRVTDHVRTNTSADVQAEPSTLGHSVRTDRWRYTLWPDGAEELYDHSVDVHEWNNLALAPEHSGVLRDLRTLIKPFDPAGISHVKRR